MDAHCDSIVVGAGPAGTTVALELARAGKHVILLDASTVPRRKVCGEYLSPLAWDILSQLGLGHIRTLAVPLDRLRVVAPGGVAIDVKLPGDSKSQPAAVTRSVLDGVLLEAAINAGVVFRAAERVRNVVITEGCITGVTTISSVNPGETQTYSARQVIAADGRHSKLIRQTGVVHARSQQLVGFKRHLNIDPHAPLPGSAISMYSLGGGYVGVCRVDEHSVNVCGMLPRATLQYARGDVDATVKALCANHHDLLALLKTAEPSGPWLTIADVPTQTAEARVEGILFVGDAKGTIEPLTGQGMTMSMVSAQAAARYLASCPGIDRALQDAYSRHWHASFDHTCRDAAWFGALMRRPKLLGTLLASRFMRDWFAPRIALWAQRHLAVHPERPSIAPALSFTSDRELAAHG